ncbi:MAG: glycosyltransferase involved in cell wall biosynthesis [Myxococcota bacterium]|jgi:glycosyltransferase involved in cell wall biosynthesis
MMKRDSTLVLLVLNEIDGLKMVWDDLPLTEFARVLAVDGGSTDGTREFLTEHNIPILDQPIAGRGVAFRVAAEASDTDRMVYYSPDGNEDPADIVRLDNLIADGADLAIASRFATGAVNEETDSLRPRARVNQTLTWMANRLFNHGPYVTDTINGFRAMRRRALLDLQTSVKRFPIEYQISIRAMRRRWRIVEIATIEGQRAGGESKALSWPVGKDHLKVLLSELPGSRLLN